MTGATLCSNCTRLGVPLVANGLCGRCYTHERRHGELPPADMIRSDELRPMAKALVSKRTLKGLDRLAKSYGITRADAIRMAIVELLKKYAPV
jgi:hypothetical protein